MTSKSVDLGGLEPVATIQRGSPSPFRFALDQGNWLSEWSELSPYKDAPDKKYIIYTAVFSSIIAKSRSSFCDVL